MSKLFNPKTALCIVFVAAMVMNGVDATIVNPAMLTISADFGVAPAATNLIEVGFLVSFAIVLPVAGWLGDRWGTKRVFLTALAIFTAASALCGLAWDLASLVVFRVLQGASGGLLTPVGMTMLFRAFPPEERLSLSRILTIPTALAPALGPILGGFLTEYLSWRWAFYVNVPIGIAAVLFGSFLLTADSDVEAGSFDRWGFALATPGFGLLLYALGDGAAQGWTSPLILATGLGGLLLVLLLIVVELRTPEPMLDLRLLRDRVFGNATLIAVCAAGGLLGMLYVFPLMYQDAIGASAFDSGLTVFPEALGLMLAAQLVDWSYSRLGARRLILVGLVCTFVTFGAMSLVDATTNRWLVRLLLFCVGFFLGHAVIAVQTIAFATIDGAAMGRAMSLFNVLRQIGGALGVALAASVMAGAGSTQPAGAGSPDLAAYQAALLATTAFLLIALLVATRIQNADMPSLNLAVESN